MNREMRRMMGREERRQKKQDDREGGGKTTAGQRAAAAAGRQGTERKPLFKRLAQFLREVRIELKKVSWPTRDQMVAFGTVTLVTSLALTAFVFGLDAALKELVFFAIGGSSG